MFDTASGWLITSLNANPMIVSLVELMHQRERVTNADEMLANRVRHLLAEPPRIAFCVSSEHPHRAWRNRGGPAIGHP